MNVGCDVYSNVYEPKLFRGPTATKLNNAMATGRVHLLAIIHRPNFGANSI